MEDVTGGFPHQPQDALSTQPTQSTVHCGGGGKGGCSSLFMKEAWIILIHGKGV